jgi:Tlde1 domain
LGRCAWNPGTARASDSPALNPHLTKSRLNDAPHLCETHFRNLKFRRSSRAGLCPNVPRMHIDRSKGNGGASLDARRMSTSTSACFDFVASYPRSSARKTRPFNFQGAAAVACLVLGCAWTLSANVFHADVYPQLGNVSFDSPVARRSPSFAVRSGRAAGDIVAALSEPAPLISAPATMPPGPSLSFRDRFAAAARQAVEPAPQPEPPRFAEAPKPQEASPRPAPVKVAAAVAPAPVQRPAENTIAKGAVGSVRDMAQRAKAAVMSITSSEKQTIVEKLWGKAQAHSPSLLAFASADASVTGSLGPTQNPALAGNTPRYDRSTAVYDISARTVYLPDGTKLEAHSGLGSKLDDPSSANIRMRGVTPPHVYELTPRESLFHGVAALRLTPVGGEEAIFGRTGLLAHSFMLGPNGDSNGCVSFRDYNAFLNAYRNQGIKRLAVVAKVE